MKELKQLFDNNKDWIKRRLGEDPEFFIKSARHQAPPYLWIGCADSRVPANEIVGLDAGELFVHRNVANLVVHTDANVQSVLQFGIDVLKVQHIIVCGHYGCGGIVAAMGGRQDNIIDNWLRHIRDVAHANEAELMAIEDMTARSNRLAELNTVAQVRNTCHSSIVEEAWARGQKLSVHGWVYNLATGALIDLDCCISGIGQVEQLRPGVPQVRG